MIKYLVSALIMICILLSAGCSGGGGNGDSANQDVTNSAAATIVSTESLSQHFVKVGFDQTLSQTAFDAIEFRIISGNGQALTVNSVMRTDNGAGAIIETKAQDPVLYTLMMSTSSVSASSSIQAASSGNTVQIASVTAAAEFIGTTGPEPIVLSVTALSNTSVLVTMDKSIDASYAQTLSAYRILAPNYGIPNEDIGRIQVTAASLLDSKKPNLITLTTTPLEDIEYQLVINNIITATGSFLIHPDRNGGSFFGIAPTDITPPRLMSVVSSSHTSVLANFSEPLSDTAAEPTHYQLCTIAFDTNGICPEANQLSISASQLLGSNTQVALTTAPQSSGLSYYLSVSNVTDRATPSPGNAIASSTAAQFTGSGLGAPKVASTIATDNTHLLVTFTERMSADALNIGKYRIDAPSLDIINAVFGDDLWHVVLTTSQQERRDYQLRVADIHSAEGLLIASPPEPSLFVGFASKDSQQPYLISAIAETSSRVRLYFSEPLALNALSPAAYDISYCPEGLTCTADTLSHLTVLSAQLAESDTQVVLTTANIAPRVTHQVVVSAQVTDKAMPLPHNGMHSGFATATFGLLLSDKAAPTLANMTITGPTNITLTFSEAVNPSAANPLYYRLCNQAFSLEGNCPVDQAIQVLDANLNTSSTQVTLTTAPLTAGNEYFVRITSGVTDTSGNVIATNGNSSNVVYDGTTSVADPSKLPQVVGAISTSNTSVTLSFSSVMGNSALLPANYLFTQENINPEVGTVFTMSVTWFDDTHTSVSITTTAQNEVTYRVTAVNVKDKLGNPLDTRRLGVTDPTSSLFAGSPPIAQNLQLTDTNWQWFDNNEDGEKGVGDAIVVNGNSLVLSDIDLDGSVDNWQDTNGNDLIDAGDFISGLTDSDSDGLADNEELRGTTIEIVMVNGQVTLRQVTSDPTQGDTDRDGLTDMEEWAFGSDPRSPDTDADGISDYVEWNVVYSNPADQDSDNDTLPDGLEHNFYHTSPILADTDGDQIDDAEELLSLNRDPKIADLPEIAIHIGSVNLHIDERYTYVDSQGQTISSEFSTNTSLSSSENTSFSNSLMTMEENSGGFSIGVGSGIRDAQYDQDLLSYYFLDRFFLEVNAEGHFERTTGTTVQIDNASARESQQALENSLTRANDASKGSEVTRELLGARISANVSVKNTGNVALTVKNLQISVSQIDPQNSNKFLPIATLTADSAQLTGNDLEINLGPFDNNKGPFIFANDDVYPGLVENLMRNPNSLIFKVVNYDIADEYERNFSFASQLARDRTSGITFDFGELGSQAHYVATNGVLNDGKYLGGFDEVGQPLGLPLGYLLETVLGIPKHQADQDYIDGGNDASLSTVPAGDDVLATVDGEQIIAAGTNGVLETTPADDDRLRNDSVRTGIIAGADKRVDSIAQGDDVQLVPFGTTGVAPKALVIDPGSNGILESGRSGDDVQEFMSGYQVQTTCSIASTNKTLVGAFCSASALGCSCDGPKGLVRVNTFRNGDYGNTWFTRLNGDMPTAVDFDQIKLKPGQDVRLAFLQDLDKDGLFAHEEFVYGSIDSSVNQYDNNQFRPIVVNQHYQAKTPAQLAADSLVADVFADSMDTDRDGIGDYAEAKLGWLISRNGELKQVYSSPSQVDSDNDGLWDIQEQDLRAFCNNDGQLDPRQDALCKPIVVAKVAATGIIVGKDGRLNTFKSGDDEYALFIPKNTDADPSTPDEDDRFNRGLMFATVAILPGPNGLIDTTIAGDDEYINASVTLPATDPMQRDTDLDRVSDGDELFGYAVGMGIVEGAETECNNLGTTLVPNCQPALTWGIANTRAQGDDVQRIYPGSRTKVGDMIVSAGANGILETFPEGDDVNINRTYVAAGADRILNCVASNDPNNREVFNADSSIALDPYAPGIWNISGDANVADSSCFVTSLDAETVGKDIKLYGRVVVTDPLRRDTDNDLIPDGFEIAIGADPTIVDGDSFRDSDFDGLSDAQETQGWVVAINGAAGKIVRSNALLPDSDFDGLPDYVERDIGASPNLKDTDNDGLDDYAEFRSVSRFTQDGSKRVYSAFDYTYLPNVFSNFSLVVNPSAYNTDPVFADSDKDGLSDFAELVTGYQIKVTGQSFLGPLILTNPNKADTDGDGLSDYTEATGTVGANDIIYITSATSADTDGDGTSDDLELRSYSLTDPTVPDAMFKVTYESVFISNLDSCALGGGQIDTTNTTDGTTQGCPNKTHVLWWLYANGNDGAVTGKHLISSSDEFAYTPEGSVRPLAAGHSSLVSNDASFNNALMPSEIPSSASTVPGLKMQAQACGEEVIEGTDCDPLFTVNYGDTGYSDNANINWGGDGVPGIWDHFRVKWSGEIFVDVAGEHEFFVLADDGVRIFIDGDENNVLTYFGDQTTQLEPASDAEIWRSQNTLRVHGVRNLSEGWHRIVIDYFDWNDEADIKVEWTTPSVPTKTILPRAKLRHPLGDGSYSCVALERDPKQSSYISLNRSNDLDNLIAPVALYSPGIAYYGATKGSELKIFREVVAQDTHELDLTDPTDRPASRYYLDLAQPIYNISGTPLSVKELVATAIDLAASRNIISKLVRPDVSTTSISTSAEIKTDINGDRYFELSDAGRMLYQQLQAENAYGQQSFVVKEGGSIELSGILMKVDDLQNLTSCPIGASGVVSQFGSGCTKRFSRTISYADVQQQPFMTLNLADLKTQTYSSSGSGGCDMDLTTNISLGQ